jgi:hypothetical protein
MRIQTSAPSPKQFAEPNRRGSRHWFAPAQNIVQVLAGNTEKPCDLDFFVLPMARI